MKTIRDTNAGRYEIVGLWNPDAREWEMHVHPELLEEFPDRELEWKQSLIDELSERFTAESLEGRQLRDARYL